MASKKNVVSKTPAELEEERRKKEAEAQKSQTGKAVGGILGLLPSIAGAIPGLLPSRQRGALERLQRGEGAGATAARQAGSEAGRRTAGNLGGRGSAGQVRAGIASAERQTAIGAREAASIGAREGIVGTQGLIEEERRRRALGLRLGAGVGGAIATGVGVALAGEDQGPAGPEVAAALTAPPAAGVGAPAQAFDQQGFIDQAQQGLTGLQEARQEALPAGPPAAPQQGAAPAPEAPQQDFALGAIVSPEQGFEEAKQNFTRSVIRRKSELPLSSAGGSDDKAKQDDRMRNRFLLEDFLQGEVARFNATGGALGISPEAAEEQLRTFDMAQGGIVDFARAGGQ